MYGFNGISFLNPRANYYYKHDHCGYRVQAILQRQLLNHEQGLYKTLMDLYPVKAIHHAHDINHIIIIVYKSRYKPCIGIL